MNADLFGEALAIPAIVHSAPTSQRALAIGPAAASLLTAASRYPFTELVYIGEDAPQELRSPVRPDRRLRIIPGMLDLPREWFADIIAVASPGLSESALNTARRLSGKDTVTVVAVDKTQSMAELRKRLMKLWRSVAPYREHIPEAQYFFLVSDMQLSAKRPVPVWTKRLNEAYMPSMFRLGKDELALFAPPQQPQPNLIPTVANLKGKA